MNQKQIETKILKLINHAKRGGVVDQKVYELAKEIHSKCDLADVSGSYLVKFIDPNKQYPVNYTIKQDGTKVFEPQMLIGSDLTQPQIVELFNKQLL